MLGDAAAKVSALAALFALVLLVSLFLPWAQVVCVQEPCLYPTGWEVLRFLDVLLCCLAVGSMAVALLSVVRPATGPAVGLIALGAVALVLVFLAPGVEDRGPQPVDFGGSWFLGVLGALGVVAGGVATYFIRAGLGGDEEEGEEGEGDSEEAAAADDAEGGEAAAGEDQEGDGGGQAGEGEGGEDEGAGREGGASAGSDDGDGRDGGGDGEAHDGGGDDSRT